MANTDSRTDILNKPTVWPLQEPDPRIPNTAIASGFSDIEISWPNPTLNKKGPKKGNELLNKDLGKQSDIASRLFGQITTKISKPINISEFQSQ